MTKPEISGRRVEKPAVRTRQIIDAALHVFSRKGVHQSSVDEIVEKAGVSKGLLYLYFKGKDALIEAVMAKLFEPDLKQAERLLQAEGAARERLLAYARSITEDAERYRKLLPLLFEYYSMIGRNRKLRDITAGYYRQQEDLLRGLVQQGIQSGEFSGGADAQAVAVSLLALQEGFVMRWMMDPGTNDWNAQAEQSMNLVLDAIDGVNEIDGVEEVDKIDRIDSIE